MKIGDTLGINDLILSKIDNNKKLRELLILINQDAEKALLALRALYNDDTLFANYDIMLTGSERSIAISNMVNRINEQMNVNYENMTTSININLTSVRDVLKERFKLTGIATVTCNLESLYTKLADANVTNLVNNMYTLDKIHFRSLAAWFNINKDNIENLMSYDISTFILNTDSITSSYVQHSLELMNMGIPLDIEFDKTDKAVFEISVVMSDAINKDISVVENIRYLVETSIGIEPRVEVINQSLFNTLDKFKPNANALDIILKLALKSTADYNENKITGETYMELNKNYDNMLTTYFNIFYLRLVTLSSFLHNYVELTISNLNQVVMDITYLQNSLK